LSTQGEAAMQAGIHNVRGLAYKRGGPLKQALAEYDAALAFDPNYAEALDNRGVIWDAEGKYDRAIAAYNRAIAVSPSDASAYYNRGNATPIWGAPRRRSPTFGALGISILPCFWLVKP
jgi:tetratricopeptide (TPR) repeat protein